MMALRVDESIIDNKYLFAVLRSPQFQNQINNYHVGTLIPHFKKGDLDKLLIPIPSMQIQKNIGDYYFTLSHKIELNNRMNKVLEQMAQAIFKQWFVDFEFPNENGEPYKSSGGEMVWCEDLGKEIPVGWRQGQLGEIATYRNENITPNQIPVGTPYVGLEHIPRRKLDLDSFGDSSKLGSNKSCFKKNDILFGKLRPYFHKVSIAPFGGVCSTDIIPIYVKKEHYFGQLACTLFSDELINYVTQSSNGTKMPRTNWKDISQYEIILPDEHTSGNFTNIFRDIAEQFQVHFKESERLFNLRDTLLPKLMSGEIDVSEIEF
ncbi:hypothetical protein BSK61_23475 [Paenibacillus odorifer]|nr:hypothetical protein BSK61_23475 [Paenibacillus odorifer]